MEGKQRLVVQRVPLLKHPAQNTRHADPGDIKTLKDDKEPEGSLDQTDIMEEGIQDDTGGKARLEEELPSFQKAFVFPEPSHATTPDTARTTAHTRKAGYNLVAKKATSERPARMY